MTNNFLAKVLLVVILSFMLGRFSIPSVVSHDNMNMEEMREHFVSQKTSMHKDMLGNSEYQCCLEKPCTYCIEKTHGHGEGATCSCLEDVVEGRHPCGECIGEILEGHGNSYLAKYFAKSIAEEVGEEHLEMLKQIIAQKYGVEIDRQI